MDLRAIRNVDEAAWRRLKMMAAREGRPMGAVLGDAVRLYATTHRLR